MSHLDTGNYPQDVRTYFCSLCNFSLHTRTSRTWINSVAGRSPVPGPSAPKLEIDRQFPSEFTDSVASMRWDATTEKVLVNEAFNGLLGPSQRGTEVNLSELMTPPDIARLLEKLDPKRSPMAHDHGTFLCRLIGSDEQILWLETTVCESSAKEGISCRYVTFKDVTDRLTKELFFENFADSLPGIVFSYTVYPDSSHYFSYISIKTKEFFGIENREFLANPDLAFDIIEPEDLPFVRESLAESKRTMTHWKAEYRTTVKGKTRWFEGTAIPKLQPNGSVTWNGITIAIDDRKNLELELKEVASKDYLTGVFNRRYLSEFLRDQSERFDRYQERSSVILIDIDNFKAINDEHGHDFGDLVLRQFSDLVSKNVRKVDTFGRMGGEEFLIILPNTGVQSALEVGKKILRKTRSKLQTIDGIDVALTFSAGISEFSAVQSSANKVLKHADQLLYEAKSEGRNSIKTDG